VDRTLWFDADSLEALAGRRRRSAQAPEYDSKGENCNIFPRSPAGRVRVNVSVKEKKGPPVLGARKLPPLDQGK